jgi:hypothetical protein
MSRKKGIVFSAEPVLALSLRNNKNSTRATCQVSTDCISYNYLKVFIANSI